VVGTGRDVERDVEGYGDEEVRGGGAVGWCGGAVDENVSEWSYV
jgi:hypothetical protein